MTDIHIFVEGALDEVVARRLVEACGHRTATCFGKKGWVFIRDNIAKYNPAAAHLCCLTLVDLMDTGHFCPVEVISQWLPNRQPNMLLRLVVRELESWLLADRAGIASFLHVSPDHIPLYPEQVTDPKAQIINITRHSRSTRLKSALVPSQGSSAQVGRLYVSEMTAFIQKQWDITAARENAPSLHRCLLALERVE